MSHLSTTPSILAMLFYSFLTFFLMPCLITPLLPGICFDKCVGGFALGFAISVIFWLRFNKMLTK